MRGFFMHTWLSHIPKQMQLVAQNKRGCLKSRRTVIMNLPVGSQVQIDKTKSFQTAARRCGRL